MLLTMSLNNGMAGCGERYSEASLISNLIPSFVLLTIRSEVSDLGLSYDSRLTDHETTHEALGTLSLSIS